MRYTEAYHLKKPEGFETAEIEDLNDNADAIDAALSNLITISDSEPDHGPVLWFDTQGLIPIAMLTLGLAGEEGSIQLNTDNAHYPVENARLGGMPTENSYSLEIL